MIHMVSTRSEDVRLSTTSYVVLGLIALRGPSTPYDLKRAVGHSVGYFWPFPHAQLYSEPERLASAGLLKVKQEKESRRRKTYSLMSTGRRRLNEWLAEPVDEPFQVRNVAEIKLFFGELANDDDLVALAEGQVAVHEARLDEFRRMGERFGDEPDRATRMVPLTLGVRLEEAALEFWREQLA